MSGKLETLNATYEAMGNTTGSTKKNVMLEEAGTGGAAGWLTGIKALEPVTE